MMSATPLLVDDAPPGLPYIVPAGDGALAEVGARAAQEGALPLTPVQALTGGFELDAATGTASGKAPVARSVNGEPRQGFRIGDLRLMIRYEESSELSELSAVHRLPNAPDWFSGIANLHGKLTPVFDLARYLGAEPAPDAKRMLLVLARGADATGVLIDGLPERLRRFDDAVHHAGAAPQRLAPHVRGASIIAGQLWYELDTHSLLGEIELSLESSQ